MVDPRDPGPYSDSYSGIDSSCAGWRRGKSLCPRLDDPVESGELHGSEPGRHQDGVGRRAPTPECVVRFIGRVTDRVEHLVGVVSACPRNDLGIGRALI